VIAGEVTIGNRVRIGIGALLKPYITIGDDARIGMGAVVLCDVPAGETWVGNPARRLEK
jgi:acetyltransferase-like isoleucine patch superfamily enzyme